MTRDTGGPAFPREGHYTTTTPEGNTVVVLQRGKTLEDDFAGQIACGLVSTHEPTGPGYPSVFAKVVYDLAGALVAERSARNQEKPTPDTEMQLVKREDVLVHGARIEIVLPATGGEGRTLVLDILGKQLLAGVAAECLVGAQIGVRIEPPL